jgi:diguanylate cyclase (GGDEF)-like protein/PAS domain S-box-containing protein
MTGSARPRVAPPPRTEVHERELRTVVHEIADGLVVTDPDGVVQFANPAAEELLGRPGRTLDGIRLGLPLVPGEPTVVDIGTRSSPRRVETHVVPIDWEGKPALLASMRDITGPKPADSTFRAVVELAPYAVLMINKRGRVIMANAAAEKLFGYSPGEMFELPLEALLPERFRKMHGSQTARFFANPSPRPLRAGLDLYALRKDGLEIPVEISLGPVPTEEGAVVTATIEDVSRMKRDEAQLQEAEQRFRQAFEEAPIGMAMLDPEGNFVQVNRALCDITGCSRDQLEVTSLDAITHPEDRDANKERMRRVLAGKAASFQSERRLLCATQRPVLVSIHATLLVGAEGKPSTVLAQIQDITNRRRHEEKLRHLADHDPLTGLLNRRSFEQEISAHTARTQRYGGGGAAIMLDLDRFKFVNDTLGHRVGDETIVRSAKVLRSRLRETDVLARLGGDEFAVLLPHADALNALLVAEELLDALRSESLEISGYPLALTASAGIALFEAAENLPAEDVLGKADSAMYAAKNAGRDQARLHAPEYQELTEVRDRDI